MITPNASPYDFVANLWDNSSDASPMTEEQAKDDLAHFANEAKYDESWVVPEGLTPELYCEIWNEFYEKSLEVNPGLYWWNN